MTYALLAAILFGASTPCAKLLLRDVSPTLLAGMLYLGSGIGLYVCSLLRMRSTSNRSEARLTRPDVQWLALVVLFGGIAGPLLLMWGLMRTPASTSSLLLNLESVLTALLAWFVFHENFDRRIALGMLAIVAGGVLLSWSGTPAVGAGRLSAMVGPLAIAGACLAWALDNNLTRKISAADPMQIATIKGLVAGTTNLAIGLSLGASPPGVAVAALAGGLGLVGYGFSLVLFIFGLRHLGSARTGAYFASAPFVGAALSIAMLGDPIPLSFLGAAGLMGLGLWLHLTEQHGHWHEHPELEHEHRHEHDDHHQHEHPPGIDPQGPHSHRHVHQSLRHAHPHYPDIHHQHEHGEDRAGQGANC